MKPESTIPRCQHSVYDPAGDQRYCTVCSPVQIYGEVLKRIKTTVGRLTLVVEDCAAVIEWRKWNTILEEHGLGQRSGADPEDSVSVFEYFEAHNIPNVSDEEVAVGFQIMEAGVGQRGPRNDSGPRNDTDRRRVP